ncbi:hypothetical protein V8F06_013761 [Rhypophila decipiens]
MSPITRVAIAGATGNLGPAIVTQLLSAGFKVTALTRDASATKVPAGVSTTTVDYSSLSSLTAALKGQDAVVSTLGSLAVDKQLLLVEAAAAAGVKRFIPSDFGSNTVHPKAAALPVYGDKVAVQKLLKEKAAANPNFTYTIILNGPFLDWGIMVGFVLDAKNKKITLYDGGERLFSATTLESIGKAVVGSFQKFEETKNRPVYVSSAVVSSKGLLEIAKKAVGAEGWTVTDASTDELVAQAWEELKKDKPNPDVFVYNFIKAAIWGDGYGAKFDKTDNELLGIKQLSEKDLEAIIARFA